MRSWSSRAGAGAGIPDAGDDEKTAMLFGDAKTSVGEILSEVNNL